jgi:hypothetical protein
MGDYMREIVCHDVILRGPAGEKESCLMWYKDYPWHVKIKDGWKEFAAASNFVIRDRIIFNIVNIHFDNEMK